MENVYDRYSRADQDRIAVARLAGTVHRHAGWKSTLAGPELAAAVAELREVTEGLACGPELMAEVAGVHLGTRFGGPAEQEGPAVRLEREKAIVEAQLLVAAGADEFLIDGWICVGIERAVAAASPPFGVTLLAPGQRARPGS